jgi:hypothetical protein
MSKWTCWGPHAGRCRFRHASKRESEQHAQEDRREMERLGRPDLADAAPHEESCRATESCGGCGCSPEKPS